MPITLKAARVNAELTQQEVAKALNINKGTLISYEAGRTQPSIEMAKRIAELYGMTVEDIKFF